MNKKDQKIIDANEGKSPHELLLLGVSQQGFEELCEIANQQAHQAQTFTKPVLKPSNIIQPNQPMMPVLSAIGQQVPTTGKAYLIPPTGGRGTLISRTAAEAQVKRDPNFKIRYQ